MKANDDTSTTQFLAELGRTATAAGATVGDRDVLLKEYDDEKRTANFAIYIMVFMIAGYAAITVINTLASSVTARRREFGLQRLAGSTRAQVMQMVGLEGALVALSGVVIGSSAAAVILAPVSLKRLDSVVPAGGAWIFVALAICTLLLTLSAVLLPAWRATHGRPAGPRWRSSDRLPSGSAAVSLRSLRPLVRCSTRCPPVREGFARHSEADPSQSSGETRYLDRGRVRRRRRARGRRYRLGAARPGLRT